MTYATSLFTRMHGIECYSNVVSSVVHSDVAILIIIDQSDVMSTVVPLYSRLIALRFKLMSCY
jgi:hypothetical protein